MNRKEYGDRFRDHFFEQYKLYVEMADRISARRAQSNRFYLSLVSALLALFSVLVGTSLFPRLLTIVLILVAVLGVALCALWYVTIGSYRQLNSGKFKIIHKMEEALPFASYTEEWTILRTPEGGKKYRRLTRVEERVPLVLASLFIIVLLVSLFGVGA